MRYDYNTIRIFIQSDIFYKLILSWVECIALLLLVPTAVMLVQAIPRDAAAVGHEAGRGWHGTRADRPGCSHQPAPHHPDRWPTGDAHELCGSKFLRDEPKLLSPKSLPTCGLTILMYTWLYYIYWNTLKEEVWFRDSWGCKSVSHIHYWKILRWEPWILSVWCENDDIGRKCGVYSSQTV